ncbi:MAG TPA: Calx-beta domain-containing protein, partial [Steroidobacter sp.]|nr:Calx-beta domain-containing protein [Steroidobacter sp.]
AAAAPSSADSRLPAGTPAYASPEVLDGQIPEPRDDVFSLACVAYELLTGRHPFERRSSVHARDEGCLPPRAWSLSPAQWLTLLSALSWTRDRRPDDVETLASALAPKESESLGTAVHSIAAARAFTPSALPEAQDEFTPPQRSWGFFLFAACALAVAFFAIRPQGEQQTATDGGENPVVISEPTDGAFPPSGFMGAPLASPSVSSMRSTLERTEAKSATSAAPTPTHAQEERAATVEKTPPRQLKSPLSEISFESSDIITSESSVAAVFVINRSQPLSGRARIRWRAVSGAADAGTDFSSNAAGSVEFADGQGQRAIYVPLRNDLLKEKDETFTVTLHGVSGARLGAVSSATATIRDDD